MSLVIRRSSIIAKANALLSALLLFSPSAHAAAPKVQTTYGPVLGIDGPNQTVIFRGIPFATPPIAERRFARAQPPEAWTEPIKADSYALAAVQPKPRSYQGIGERGEDCLYLNVYAPAFSSLQGEKLPVLFWIHGGGFTSGTAMSDNYDATELASEGICVVVPNYRLGVLGFLAHPALTAKFGSSGNQALTDLLQALKWTKANIAAFGGDPENITVAGQSAGGSAVTSLMCMTQTEGLFHKAIIHSGGAAGDLPKRTGGPNAADEFGKAVLQKLPVGGENKSDLDRLQSATTDDLLSAWSATVKERGRIDLCIDGRYLSDSPARIFARGEHHKMPVVVGNTASEGSMFLLFNDVDTQEEYRAWMKKRFPNHTDDAMKLYPVTDGDFEAQQLHVANDYYDTHARFLARASSPDSWRYRFTRVSPFGESMAMGSFHGAEIAYLFGRVSRSESYNAIDVELGKVIRKYWITFCRSGNPNAHGLPNWPRYGEQRQFMVLGDTMTISKNWRPIHCDFIERTLQTP